MSGPRRAAADLAQVFHADPRTAGWARETTGAADCARCRERVSERTLEGRKRRSPNARTITTETCVGDEVGSGRSPSLRKQDRDHRDVRVMRCWSPGGAELARGPGATAKFLTLVSRMRTHVDRLRQVKREMMLPGVHHIVPGERDIEKIKAAAEHGRSGSARPAPSS